jgi:hypothetical protein
MCSEYRDLCSTCNYAPTCDNRSSSEKPVFYCEEFYNYVPVPVKKTSVSASAPTETIDPDKYKGLCSNCENRETCLLPRSEGGNWHCEEYR